MRRDARLRGEPVVGAATFAVGMTRGCRGRVGRELAQPAELDEPLDLGRAGVPGEDERAALLLLPDERRIARVHVRA